MKTRTLISILLGLVPFFITACNNTKNEGKWYDSVPDGAFFIRSNQARFYFVDGEGKSLIDPTNVKTFPVSAIEGINDPAPLTEDYDGSTGYYNGCNNTVYFDEDEGLYVWSVGAYGDSKYPTYRFYVYVNGEKDIMDVTYKYTDEGVEGSRYYAKIVKWKYNGKYVFSDLDKIHKKIFIKKYYGKTEVYLK